MTDFKNIIKKIIFLPPISTVMISIPSCILAFYVLTFENTNRAINYFSYGMSTYALIISLTLTYSLTKELKSKIKDHVIVQKIINIPIINKYVTDYKLRSHTSLGIGFILNLFYMTTKMIAGIYYHSVWFTTLAGYYMVLAIMRFFLIHSVKKNQNNEGFVTYGWRNYRLCGIFLLTMNFTISGIIILAIYDNSGFRYPGMLIYFIAMYDLCAIVASIVNVIKYRKYGDPIVSATKVINLTVALVSILSLETAMLSEFGANDNPLFKQVLMSISGLIISIIILSMANYMIIHSTKILKLQKMKDK